MTTEQREKNRLKMRRWRAKNPEKVRANNLASRARRHSWDPRYQFRRNIWHKYRITIEIYDAMILKSEGRCAMCESRSFPLVVDHCHLTGQIRGMICPPCNTALGFLEQPGALEAAHNYLVNSYGC